MATARSTVVPIAAHPLPAPSLTDACLVERIKAGEQVLFHELIRPYERGLYLVAYSVVRNVDDAEEVAQETILKALTHLNRLRSSKKFKQWLFQIAVNEARMRRRKYRRARHDSLDEGYPEQRDGDSIPSDFPDHRPLPSDVLEQKELQVAVRRAVSTLPPMYREACLLRDVEHLQVEEVARVLGISVSAAKTRCHRARLRLRKALMPFFYSRSSQPSDLVEA